ncbi:MAG: tRNA (guanosine(46)-N7)-methyltransferase TrmB [Deltaproteobacteria bacterium]|nr:tRNA (guanosine(46)-N7)-methyltransferase TrmB [Deltaproteobacteria bacterium]MBW2417016.1 tRNA (guanosine(46)-N7)-methyltransferase TrmB [Deltaproteobacteria bacterium]
MSRTLKYDIPGIDWRRSVSDFFERDWRAVFAPELESPGRLVVEIGFGRGEFLLDLAAKCPETAFVGVEVSFKRVLKMARRLARSDLRNLRLVEGRGESVVQDLLEPGSVHEIWVNFSDPWPKAAHAGRRVIQPDFVKGAALGLAPGGVLHIATDDAPYAEQIDACLRAELLLENLYAPRGWVTEVPGRLTTAYELEWRAEGRPLHFFDYRRRG